MRILPAFLATALPLAAFGDCTVDPARMLPLSAEPLEIRNSLYAQYCSSGGGELFDITDPALKGRLTYPHGGMKALLNSQYPHELKVTLIVAYLVDIDGHVQHPTLLTHSGDAHVDAQAARYWDHFKYETPAKLDGRPVRVLMYFKMLPFNTPLDTHGRNGT